MMTSFERVLTALEYKEPDRAPLFLLLTMHGAKELSISIRDYFSNGKNVAAGQMRLQKKYNNDCYYNFFYAPIETEAFGGTVLYISDGPPNSGNPLITAINEIDKIIPPKVAETQCLAKVLEATEILKTNGDPSVPIIGVVMSPFSLPVMQLGFEMYVEVLYNTPVFFWNLMEINKQFCIEWANAQIEAGAAAICYFDPMSSPTMIPRDLYLKTGYKIAKETLAEIKGPTATHMASGNCLEILDDVAGTGTNIICTSISEDIAEIKEKAKKRLAVLGNLNGIEMRKWTREQSEYNVKQILMKAGRGGGLILSDNHGEIPWQVPDAVLKAISRSVQEWGNYPLDWIDEYE